MPTPATTVGDAFSDLAAPAAITFRGKDYPLRPASLATVALFETAVAKSMRDALEELRPVLTPAEHAAESASLREMLLVTKAHAFGGSANTAMINSPAGASLLLWSFVAAQDPSFTPQMAFEFSQEQPDAFRDAFAAVAPDFFSQAGARRGMNPASLADLVLTLKAALKAALATP